MKYRAYPLCEMFFLIIIFTFWKFINWVILHNQHYNIIRVSRQAISIRQAFTKTETFILIDCETNEWKTIIEISLRRGKRVIKLFSERLVSYSQIHFFCVKCLQVWGEEKEKRFRKARYV